MLSFIKNKHPHLLNQYKTHLSALLDRAKHQPELKDSQLELLNELNQTLKDASDWQSVYNIELQVIEYLDEDDLQTCWLRKQADNDVLSPNLQVFYQDQVKLNLVGTKLKSMLAKLVCDLQWRAEIVRVKADFSARARLLIALMFLLSFFVFFTPTISNSIFGHELFADNLRLYYLFSAASAGLLGASFSQLTSMRSNISKASIEQIRTMSHFSYVIARSVIGAGAGLIMFYIIQSELINLPIFPEFISDQRDLLDLLTAQQAEVKEFLTAGGELSDGVTKAVHKAQSVLSGVAVESLYSSEAEKTASLIQNSSKNLMATAHSHESELRVGGLLHPSKGISLLIIWCIIAGFCEKLIPGILNNAEKKALKASETSND
ncbi:MAG: hypothetical protein HRU38_03480 [Saccharospirillaceae bacterium]|nr:hypothetical protein [Pseudomonadales bacterium]NRB77724.1 hypothetical protein [Saccharospirillaceae bacterium]